jgi:hypothetical protein
MSLLTAASCPAPCSGGTACASSGHRACASGFTCIPGARTYVLDPGVHFRLVVSAVLLAGHVRACGEALPGGKVCIRPASAPTTTCVSLAEACDNEDRAKTAIDVTTEDLTDDPLWIEIRNRDDRTVATRTGPLFPAGLRRSALCLGARAADFTTAAGPDVEALTFFLAPAGALP